ncbi:PLP-dependent aminotransferase family protein [Roseomonas sp. E05]|uniref:aminotransferase-like domain-containing protein n=1 Tax=Roseomonas sp. E05 TaxID=3046310 RepID=UPI0024BA15FC|nr:PLP-dependent aminotransferase family protein [Roseomonas sp. E05]MDJ0388824.1 PLP-dependent aminotransferase family protein [Roseomonas sp. E05]
MANHRELADKVARQIAEGKLLPGMRLPPQRRFAEQQDIADSTAARVYAELRRRGLVSGEVGRGTFIRKPPEFPVFRSEDRPGITLDLEQGFPMLPAQHAPLSEVLRDLATPEALADLLRPTSVMGSERYRRLAADFVAAGRFQPAPEQMLFTSGGRQAVAAAIAALVPAGRRLAVEALTYPQVKAIAGTLGLHLVPIAMDAHGLRPDALSAAHRQGPLDGLYLQPALHNPLGLSMPPARRAELGAVLRQTGIRAVEDVIYRFLLGEEHEPLAAEAPEQVVLVDAMSKRLAPGLSIGIIAAPPALTERMARAIRAGCWGAGGFAQAACSQWIASGVVRQIEAAKRADAAARQALARRILPAGTVQADPRAYHLWLRLPETWSAEAFTAHAARAGIAVSPGGNFAVLRAQAPRAVRLSLAVPPFEALAPALHRLADAMRAGPEGGSFD